MNPDRTLPWDWYPGTIPENAAIGDAAYLETTFSFYLFRSQLACGVEIGRGASTYLGTMFDVGPKGHVKLGEFALVHGARIICDSEIIIGDYALISWNVVLMDTYRVPFTTPERRKELELLPARVPRQAVGAVPPRPVHFDGDLRSASLRAEEVGAVPARPIHIEGNVWIGFESCVLPGVTIGAGSVVGARSVVTEDVPPYTVVAGNPARAIRRLDPDERQGSAMARRNA